MVSHIHTPGMGIVKNANFCNGVTDFSCFFASLFVHLEKKLVVQKKEKKKNETPVFCTEYP